MAKAGAPVSPTRKACPRPLDFLRRRAAVASECNWRSAAELSSGNGSDFVEVGMVGGRLVVVEVVVVGWLKGRATSEM